MKDTEATPMIAARRRRKGPRGQPKGSITTDPNEVDAVCRELYGAIYKGNTADPELAAERYIKL